MADFGPLAASVVVLVDAGLLQQVGLTARQQVVGVATVKQFGGKVGE